MRGLLSRVGIVRPVFGRFTSIRVRRLESSDPRPEAAGASIAFLQLEVGDLTKTSASNTVVSVKLLVHRHISFITVV